MNSKNFWYILWFAIYTLKVITTSLVIILILNLFGCMIQLNTIAGIASFVGIFIFAFATVALDEAGEYTIEKSNHFKQTNKEKQND